MSYTNPFKYRYDKLKQENNALKGIPEEEKIEVMNEEPLNQVTEESIIDINDILNTPDENTLFEYTSYYNIAKITGMPRSLGLSELQLGQMSVSYETALSNIIKNML